MNYRTGFICVVLMVLALAGCQRVSTGDKAPDFETTLIDGTAFKLSDLSGQYVVLDFWGSWCAPCIREMPELVALHAKYGDNVAFVTVALERGGDRWKTASEKAGFSWKYQIVEEAKVLLASPIARTYGVTEIPTRFIITPEGKLLSGMDLVQMDAYLGNTAL